MIFRWICIAVLLSMPSAHVCAAQTDFIDEIMNSRERKVWLDIRNWNEFEYVVTPRQKFDYYIYSNYHPDYYGKNVFDCGYTPALPDVWARSAWAWGYSREVIHFSEYMYEHSYTPIYDLAGGNRRPAVINHQFFISTKPEHFQYDD